MEAAVVSLRWTAKARLASVAVAYLKLTPHYDAAGGLLGFVHNETWALEVEVVAHAIKHQREDSLLKAGLLLVPAEACASCW